MTVAKSAIALNQFLKLPETKPASEFIDGEIFQKSMPKSRHSRLQGKLIDAVNGVAEKQRIAYAFPELRCTFGDRSIVPDIAVLRWNRINFDENGEPVGDVFVAPDWTIETLSPDPSSNRVSGNILHCLKHGCQLGWLLDNSDRSILIFQPNQQPELRSGKDELTVLPEIDLNLTVEEVFNWLKMQP